MGFHPRLLEDILGQSPQDLFLRWVLARGGLRAESYRATCLRRRLPACLRALRCCDCDEARQLIRRQPPLLDRALNALIIGVTSFFRDAPTFQALESWLASKRSPRLRVWSVGCSDGCELYSVAIILQRLGLLPTAQLLGTDCRAQAIEQAQQALYDSWRLGNLDSDVLSRYFFQTGKHWRPVPQLTSAVTWAVSDALNSRPPGLWDVILCRNLAIYLNPGGTKRLWSTVKDALDTDGLLVTGRAERPPREYRFTPFGPCLFRGPGAFVHAQIHPHMDN